MNNITPFGVMDMVRVRTQTLFNEDIIYDTDKSYDVIEYASRAIMDFLRKIAEDIRKAGFNVDIQPDYQNLLLDIRVKGNPDDFADFLDKRIDKYNELWDEMLSEIERYIRERGITGFVIDFSADKWEVGLWIANAGSASTMLVTIYEDLDTSGNYIMGMLRKTTVIKPETPINKEMIVWLADYFIFGNDDDGEHVFEVTEDERELFKVVEVQAK